MRTVQQGDQVQVHYALHFPDGSTISSAGRPPLELTIGIPSRHFPGSGLGLLGMAPGGHTTLKIPPEHGFGVPDPTKIHRWSHSRLPTGAAPQVGKFMRVNDRRGRRRLVRVLEVTPRTVVFDANHPWAGQALEVEIELITIREPNPGPRLSPVHDCPQPSAGDPEKAGAPQAASLISPGRPPAHGRAVAFDVDPASLAGLQDALPGWQFDCLSGATVSSLPSNWDPGAVELFILGVRQAPEETLDLCRFLACNTFSLPGSRPESEETRSLDTSHLGPARWGDTPPLLVLLAPGQRALRAAALDAGARCCLILPVTTEVVSRLFNRAKEEGRPGEHTHDPGVKRPLDPWQDDGGRG